MSEGIARDVLNRQSRMESARVNWDSHWQEIAERVLPKMSGEFFGKGFRTTGDKRTEYMFDSTAPLALDRFTSVMDSMITPQGSKWHSLSSPVPALSGKLAVRAYYDEVRDILFRYRYSPNASFISQNLENWNSLGAFGTGGLFVDRMDGGGIRYRSLLLSEWYFLEGHHGRIDTAHRKFRMTARNIVRKFSEKGDVVPEVITAAVSGSPDREFDLIHCIVPREDVEYGRLGPKGMKFASHYVCVDTQSIIRESGYRTFPLAISRYTTAPGEVYGRSPAMMALPAIKVLNEQKKTSLKMGHRLADPVFLAFDDGIIDSASLRPGSLVAGGISQNGNKLIQPLDSSNGQLQAVDKLMDAERMVINDVFLVNLFQILTETPQMTATEVMERTREKGMLLAPTMGRQQAEYLGPLIEREIDILSSDGLLPPMPQELMDIGGEYTVAYESPLSRGMRAEEATGFMRFLETSLNVAAQMQDPSALDHINFDAAMPDLAEIMGVPAKWVSSPEMIAERRQGRQQQQGIDQLSASLPGIAALAKSGVGRGGGL